MHLPKKFFNLQLPKHDEAVVLVVDESEQEYKTKYLAPNHYGMDTNNCGSEEILMASGSVNQLLISESQKSYLRDQLIDGMHLQLVIGFISETINIVDARFYFSSYSEEALKMKRLEKVKTEEELKALEIKGGNVKEAIVKLDSEIEALEMKGERLQAVFRHHGEKPRYLHAVSSSILHHCIVQILTM
ncbi:hypothetical protein POM88_002180 [Heracleum sosnowskyi]|uniref:Uncharacterized protein n=1 Tax=Heracleum sosnowskyi TaxID=360622 RepID=A0AAD8JDL4_9APIA|nr:hypothetical protein POM88_002180 [Heracleum sosnowskyi]